MSADTSISISVVIPAHNAQQSIEGAVNSVLNQTCFPDEIIVVDDGSTDNTPKILEGFGDKITVIHQENAGASVARNTGIQHASGNWIAFLDADDEWLPSKLEIQIDHLKNKPNLVWSHSNYWIEESSGQGRKIAFGSSPSSLKEEVISDYLETHAHYCIRPSTLIVKKSVLYDAGLFVPHQKWEDTDLVLKISYKHPKVGYLSAPLSIYRSDSPKSLTSIHRFFASERCDLIEQHLKLSGQYNRRDTFRKSASDKVPYWINMALVYNQYKDARIMVQRFWSLLPTSFKWEFAMRAYLPYIGNLVFKALKRANSLIPRFSCRNR